MIIKPAENIIALFPIKLETRFVENANKLRIRVYPDQIAVDSHREGLSEIEKKARDVYNAQPDKRAAWRTIFNNFRAERASWIIQSGSAGNASIDNWKPTSNILPRQFTFFFSLKVTINDKNIESPEFKVSGKKRSSKSLSIDPIDEENSWIVNFEEAVQIGMAIEVDLAAKWPTWKDAEIQNRTVQEIVVVGIRDDFFDTPNLLEKLFKGHKYSTGLEFILPGTPTNNTTESSSGFSSKMDSNESYQTNFGPVLFSKTDDRYKKSDGQILAEALGINANTFHHVKGSGRFSRRDAKAMNTTLWQATLAPYLEEFFNNSLEENFLEALDWLREFFIENIMGRGPLPTIRVGKQPYGIMPISVLDGEGSDYTKEKGGEWESPYTKLQENDQPIYETLEMRFEKNLTQLLKHIRSQWVSQFDIENRQVLVDEGGDGFHEKFMNILGLQPHSVAFSSRFIAEASNIDKLSTYLSSSKAVDTDQLTEKVKLKNEGSYGITNLSKLGKVNTLNVSLVAKKIDEKVGLPKDIKITAYFTNNRGGVSTYTIHQNYIEYLSRTSVPKVIEEMQGGTTEDGEAIVEKSDTVLFILLRTALLNQYWDTAMRIFEKIGLRDFRLRSIMEQEEVKNEINSHNDQDVVTFIEEIYNYNLNFAGVEDQSLNEIESQAQNENNGDFRLYRFLYYFLPVELTNHDGKDTPLTQEELHQNWVEKKLQRNFYKDFVLKVEGDPLEYLFSLKDGNYYNSSLLKANNKLPFLSIETKPGELPGTSSLSDPIPIWRYIKGLGRIHMPEEVKHFHESTRSLNILQKLSSAELERLLAEHIDLCTYRLDAWLLGLINKRLVEIRSKEVTFPTPSAPSLPLQNNTFLGAYGYVENLKPKSEQANKQGFVHAPSLGQATAAAILRSGFEATGDNSAAAVNLSSQRVEAALFYLEGIKNGRFIGELLGYKFERYLHDNNLNEFLYELRKAYPFSPLKNTISSNENNFLRIDGEKLIGDQRSFEELSLYPIPTTTKLDLLTKGRDKLKDDLDAVGDVLLAEAIYQMSMGNYERANAALSVINKGSIPPELEFIKTPRQGHDLTHRVCIQWRIVERNTSPKGWSTIITPRALAEPSFNYWLEKIIGDPSKIGCIVQSKGGDKRHKITIQLNELELQPLDVYCFFLDSSMVEISSRIFSIASNKTRIASNQKLSNTHDILFDQTNENSDYSFNQLKAILHQLHSLLSKGRRLKKEDLLFAQQSITDSDELPETKQRIIQIKDDLSRQIKSINDFTSKLKSTITIWVYILKKRGIKNFPSQYYKKLRDAVFFSTYYGSLHFVFEKKIPSVPKEEDARELLSLAYHVKEILIAKLGSFEKRNLKAEVVQSSDEKGKIYALMLREIFGSPFKLYPSYQHNNSVDFIKAFNRSEDSSSHHFLPKRSLPMEEWLSSISRVREQMDTLEKTNFLIELSNSMVNRDLELTAIQLPYRKNDNWVGMELPENYFDNSQHPTDLSKNKLSLVSWASEMLPAPNQRYSGVLVDEWVESIPNQENLTGLAYNYNQPNNEAPQSILLAVTPSGNETFRNKGLIHGWNQVRIKRLVMSAIKMAKLRAIEPDDLLQDDFYSKLLPTVMGRVVSNRPDIEIDISTDLGKSVNNPLFQ